MVQDNIHNVNGSSVMIADKYAIALTVNLDDLADQIGTSSTFAFIEEVRFKLDTGEVEWLKQHGKVYYLIE